MDYVKKFVESQLEQARQLVEQREREVVSARLALQDAEMEYGNYKRVLDRLNGAA